MLKPEGFDVNDYLDKSEMAGGMPRMDAEEDVVDEDPDAVLAEKLLNGEEDEDESETLH